MSNENQTEIERLRQEVIELKAELTRFQALKAENKALRTKLSDAKSYRCQSLTEKGEQCPKKAVREHKKDGFILYTCERHHQVG
jgi:regulator of replication initiation timing